MTVLLDRVRIGAEVYTPVPLWRMKGSCRGSDPTVFYPDPDDDSQAEKAKAICAECCVVTQCREFALSTREKNGVWGGLTERERRRVLRQRRKSA